MDILQTELAQAYMEHAPVQELECLLNDYRIEDAGNYPAFKRKVEQVRSAKVRIEHNFPRIRSLQW